MSSRYDRAVDPEAQRNAHTIALAMVGQHKRVLELGAAGGHVTAALRRQGCAVTAVENDEDALADLRAVTSDVVVADLNAPDWADSLQAEYDVVLAGDVLEHLLDPAAALRRVVTLLKPSGYVVVSLPNIAHADVRLALLQGRFDYTEWGLLDRTHVRFFTLKSVRALAAAAGLVISDLQRVRIPAFETELEVDREQVGADVLETMLADPEAETYQFVLTLVADDGDARRRFIAERNLDLEAEVDRTRRSVTALTDENARLRAEIGGLHEEIAQLRDDHAKLEAEVAHLAPLAEAGDELHARIAELNALHEHARADLARVLATRTMRYTARARAVYGRLRRDTPGSHGAQAGRG